MEEKGYSLWESDLAEERHGKAFCEGGIRFERWERGGIRGSELYVLSSEGVKAVGRDVGRYTTLSFPPLGGMNASLWQNLIRETVKGLKAHLPRQPSHLLVAGLGNRHLTADALGVRTAEALHAGKGLSVFIPRTEGETGLSSALLVKAAVRAAKPDAVLLLDALAGSDPARLLSAIELCGTGLAPGSGVRGEREAINEGLLGIPTAALGVPTVMRAGALLRRSGAEVAGEAEGLWVIPSALDAGIGLLASLIGEAIHVFCDGE